MSNNVCGVYKIASKVHPDRFYIGSAVNIRKRWSRHKKDLERQKGNDIFQNHYNKYGFDDLVFSVVAVCDKEELMPINGIIRPEQFFMWAYDPYFNVNKIAGSCMGTKRVFTEEHKRHMSEGRKGIVFTEEHCNNISKAQRGKKQIIKKLNPNFHANSGSWKKGNVPWNKGKETGQTPWNKGKKTGVRPSTMFKKGSVPWNKGKPHSEEHKANLKKARAKRLSMPDSEETRELKRQGSLRRWAKWREAKTKKKDAKESLIQK